MWTLNDGPHRPASKPSGKPPALADLHPIERPVRGGIAVSERVRMGIDERVEHEVDEPTVVMDELLHLGIHAGALVVVGLGTRLDEKLVEPRVLPERVVPRGVRRIGGREHPVAGRTARPVGGDERLLEPDIVPVGVFRLTDDVEVDARRLRMLPPQEC